MDDFKNINNALAAFRKMKPTDRHHVLLTLMDEGTIDIMSAVAVFGTHLEQFKAKATHDLQRVSEAGLHLAEKEIKKIPAIKSDNKRGLAVAMARSLLTFGYIQTEHGDELREIVSRFKINEDWYRQCWKPKITLTNESQNVDKDAHATR